MTDTVNALIVTLETNIRTDDVVDLINAIKQLRGVLTVDQNIANFDSHVADQRARFELGEKLLKVIYPS